MRGQTRVRNGTVHTLCGMCNTRCGIGVVVRNGTMVEVEPAAGHPINQGRICPRADAALDVFYHRDRVLTPLKRKPDGSFAPIPRAQAMEEIATELARIKADYGARAVGVWKGEGVGFQQQEAYARRFIHAFGSPNYFSNDSACYNGRYLGHSLVTGFYHPFPNFKQADLILLFGTNPPMGHPPFMREFADARQRGAKLVVIDPRLNPVACYADVFAQPFPGTDGALGWGLIRCLIESKNYDHDLVEHHALGFEQICRYAQRFTPEYVEAQSGVFASVVVEIAGLLIRSRPRVSIFAGTGLEHNENGVNAVRTLAVLACLCGTLDTPHGLFWPDDLGTRRLTLYEELPLEQEAPIGADRFPVLYQTRKECHTMTAMDCMLEKGDYPLKALVLTAANPAVTHPNTRKTEAALSSLELLVVHDLFLTPTAALAHYVLPAATFLERTELHVYHKEQRVILAPRVVQVEGVGGEYMLWRNLAHALGFGSEYFPWEDEEEVNRWILEPTGITLDRLQAHPEGVVYGTPRFRKYRQRPLPTPSGKVEFTSAYLKALGLPEIPEYRPPYYMAQHDARYPFVLTTGARKSLFYHSRHQNIPRFRTIHPSPELEIHPEDAAALGIEDGERVRVVSQVGSVKVPARIVGPYELRQGVVEMYHGWEACRVNQVTFDHVNDPISGFPLLKGVPVRIEKLDGPGGEGLNAPARGWTGVGGQEER